VKRLALIRHADASRDNPALKDFDRPLTNTGKNNALKMASAAAADYASAPLIVTSPALRAISTAQIFASALAVQPIEIVKDMCIYDASAGSLLHLINHLVDDDQPVLLFGHNPGLSTLAHCFADMPFYELPTCAVLELEFPHSRWQEVVPGSATVLRYRHP
jgi:phosphohistidine phosphatase